MADQNIEAPGAHVEALTPVMSVGPIKFPAPGRGLDIEVRVSAPLEGSDLPVILFSHGNGQSLHAYGPLTNYWAAHGFIVIQPTHLDSRLVGLPHDDWRRPQLWRHRERDLTTLLGELSRLVAALPIIKGRVDEGRIAVAGHSWGAQTASMLLGATHPNPEDGSSVKLMDSRVKAGVLLTIPGRGGANLSPFAAQNFPFMHPDFSEMRTPALIVAGDHDHGAMTVRGPEWWREAYDLSPGPKALFTVAGGEHSLGGIPNYEARETTDERPLRVAAIQRLSTAYLRHILCPGDTAWAAAVADPVIITEGRIETK